MVRGSIGLRTGWATLVVNDAIVTPGDFGGPVAFCRATG
jgi:hypothetical protein